VSLVEILDTLRGVAAIHLDAEEGDPVADALQRRDQAVQHALEGINLSDLCAGTDCLEERLSAYIQDDPVGDPV
jgi:hypothetical protein